MTNPPIVGGSVFDGTGARPRTCDVAIANGRITAIEADLGAFGARETIDATGRLVTPGFVMGYDATIVAGTVTRRHGVDT